MDSERSQLYFEKKNVRRKKKENKCVTSCQPLLPLSFLSCKRAIIQINETREEEKREREKNSIGMELLVPCGFRLFSLFLLLLFLLRAAFGRCCCLRSRRRRRRRRRRHRHGRCPLGSCPHKRFPVPDRRCSPVLVVGGGGGRGPAAVAAMLLLLVPVGLFCRSPAAASASASAVAVAVSSSSSSASPTSPSDLGPQPPLQVR